MARIALIFLLLIASLSATEKSPWLGNYLEVESRATYHLYTYDKVASTHHHFHKSDTAHFLTLSTAVSGQRWAGEIETTLANTDHQRPALDNFRLTARYRLTNDILGDLLTITPGITYTQAFKHSVHDISSFHHGRNELDAFLAFGKECSQDGFWTKRCWSVLGCGIAERGSPWLYADLYLEKNCWDIHQLQIFVKTLWGLGNSSLKKHNFDGYGPVRHQSVDVGLRYFHFFSKDLIASLGFAHRFHAKNFPAHANIILISLEYHFGIFDFPLSNFLIGRKTKF